MAHRRHAVLAAVSRGCPPPNDKSLRDTHPSATASTRKHRPCDLHVLSMPPAFALSQDQTLRFIPTPNPTSQPPPRVTRKHEPKPQAKHPESQPSQAKPKQPKPQAATASTANPRPKANHPRHKTPGNPPQSKRHNASNSPRGAANISLPLHRFIMSTNTAWQPHLTAQHTRNTGTASQPRNQRASQHSAVRTTPHQHGKKTSSRHRPNRQSPSAPTN